MGRVSGRWARFVAPRVGRLHCIDPSSALAVARQTLAAQLNVQFHQASVASSGLQPSSQDFGTSLGVLHHVPDTAAARLLIRRLPPRPKQLVTGLIALSDYWPLARLAGLAERMGLTGGFLPPELRPQLQLLHDAHRRSRSLRHPPGAALQPRPDPPDVHRRRAGGSALLVAGALLACGGVQSHRSRHGVGARDAYGFWPSAHHIWRSHVRKYWCTMA